MTRRLLPIALLLAAFVTLPGPGRAPEARAGAPTVVLQCRTGFSESDPHTYFSGRNRFGEWVPFHIVVTNPGPAVSGTLVVVSSNYQGQTSRFEKRVDVPTGAQQEHEILALITNGNGAPVIKFEVGGSAVAEETFSLKDEGGATTVRVGVVDLDSTALNDINSVTIDTSTAHQPFQKAFRTPAPAPPASPAPAPPPPVTSYGPLPQASSIAPAVMKPHDLPHSWLAYRMLDALVLNDAPLGDLDDGQVAAIRYWVASGGMLIVAGGADYPGLRRSGLDDLLPVDVAERRAVPEAPGLVGLYGPFDSAGAPLLAIGTVRPGASALVETDGLPVVAERAYGAGTVRFLAVDPKLAPYRGWKGSAGLWTDLLYDAAATAATSASYSGYPYTAITDRLALLYDLADVHVPYVGYYFLYLLCYLLAIGPINYLVLRYLRRLELAWVTIPALVLVFSFGTIVAAQVTRGGRTVLVSTSVDEFFQAEGVSFSRSQLLVVPSAKDTYRLTFPAGALAMSGSDPYGNGGTTLESSLDETEPAAVLAAPMSTWETNPFDSLAASHEESPLQVRLLGGQVSATNASGDPMRNVVVATPSGLYALGDLAPGGQATSSRPEFVSKTFNDWYGQQLAGYPDGKRYFASFATVVASNWSSVPEASPSGLFTLPSLDQSSLGKLKQPVAVAMREGARATAAIDSGARERRISLVISHLEGNTP